MFADSITTVFVSLVSVILVCSANASDLRMVGSPTVPVSSIPYIVQLRLPREFLCGGTLITPLYVVTAAHCIYGEDFRTITVVGGASSTREVGIQRSIVDTFVPPEFTMARLEKDIAVLKLDRSMTGPNIKHIPLCSKTMTDGDLVTISGWGRLYYEGPLSEQLRSVTIPVTSNANCIEKHKPNQMLYPDAPLRVTNNMFCVVGDNQGFCNGDSGGPIVYQNQLCGVVSWSYGCAYQDVPGVVARIDVVRSFIENSLKK